MPFDKHPEYRAKWRDRHFWARGYYVSTVGNVNEKTIIKYIQEYKKVGANGVVIAEPLAGLLSPALAQEFSGDYSKRIVEAVRDENFAVIFHNCGNTANITLDSMFSNGANAYHFGNAVDMAEIMEKAPADIICMGNVDPAGEFRNGTPESSVM